MRKCKCSKFVTSICCALAPLFLLLPAAQVAATERLPAAINTTLQSTPSSTAQLSLGTLGEVLINRNNIFSGSNEPLAVIPNTINRFHTITKDKVIRREVWLEQGQSVTQTDLQELERNLRDLDLFADISVSTEAASAADPSLINLVINTRDRLSIVFSAGGSFLGGIGEVTFTVGDKNLFGLGHRLLFGYAENTEGELLGSVAYDNVLVYDNDVYAGAQAGRTEEGNFAAAFIQNQFLNFHDPDSWKIEASSEQTRIDYYEQGQSVAEVPRQRRELKTNLLHRIGSAKRNSRAGALLEFSDTQYSAATGSGAAEIDLPSDRTSVYIAALLATERVHEYRTVTWLDTLSYKQDLKLGLGLELAAGAETIETEEETRTRPHLKLIGWSRNAIGKNTYLNGAFNGLAKVGNNGLDAWSFVAGMTWINRVLPRQTLAARLRYASAYDSIGLPSQQSLGEDKGLRGYPAREFNGEQSIFINIENRLQTPLNLYSFDIGVTGFVDAGWVSDRGTSFSELGNDTRASAGIGLRIGSRAILGKGLIRVDFAYPFNQSSGRQYDPTFSIAMGQVFGFKP